jgi:hypothetical protein
MAWLSATYVAALLMVVGVWFFIPSFAGKSAGALCYWTDALVPGVECTGPWAGLLAFVLNLPAALLYLPMFALAALGSLTGLRLLGMAVLYWAPIIYLAWYAMSRGECAVRAN